MSPLLRALVIGIYGSEEVAGRSRCSYGCGSDEAQLMSLGLSMLFTPGAQHPQLLEPSALKFATNAFVA